MGDVFLKVKLDMLPSSQDLSWAENRDFLSKQPAVIPPGDPAETNEYVGFTESSFHLGFASAPSD